MSKKIASIYFSEVEARRPLYGGYFKLPVVAKGEKPFILTIHDTVQRSQDPSPDGRTKITNRYPVTAREIAEDIMREWTRETVGMTPDCCPGIWIVRDEAPVTNDGSDPKLPTGTPKFDADGNPLWRAVTKEEADANMEEDTEAARIRNANWGDYLIRQGDVLAEDPKQWVLISKLMRTACRYYGRERDWLQELKDSDIKHCWSCTKTIPIQAAKCPNCHEIVDMERYLAEKARQDSMLEAAGVELGGKSFRPPVKART